MNVASVEQSKLVRETCGCSNMVFDLTFHSDIQIHATHACFKIMSMRITIIIRTVPLSAGWELICCQGRRKVGACHLIIVRKPMAVTGGNEEMQYCASLLC